MKKNLISIVFACIPSKGEIAPVNVKPTGEPIENSFMNLRKAFAEMTHFSGFQPIYPHFSELYSARMIFYN